jgi:O-antigen biosynthesis protein
MAFSVVIPSKSAANLVPCVRAIREAGETCRIIVVDDGLEWRDQIELDQFRFAPQTVHIVAGEKPFVFARNVNIGIRVAGDDDVIVLNDDALLKTPGGFTSLARVVTEPWKYTGAISQWGVIAATCNNVGNVNQHRVDGGGIAGAGARGGLCEPRLEPRMVCFVCVYIPRSTIKAVGLLDERFVDYGMDDDDYSLRVRNAGLKIGIFDGCFVDHGSLTSSYRGTPRTGGNFRPNMKLFIEKWGVDNRGLSKDRSPFRELFPS